MIGNSKAVVNQLKKEVSNQSKIRLIISGTNQFNLKNKSEIRKKIRNKLNISQDTVILIKVANLIEYKGHSFLINSLSKMTKTSNTKWKLLILGKDFGIKKDLQQQIDRNNLNKNIIFIDNVSNPRDLLFASDINILTSFQEGFSNSIIESMSAGLANIVTNVGGNIESVQDNINGFIINDFKTSELSDKISTLIHDGELLKKFSIESRKIFLEKFTLDKCIDSYKKIYNIK